MQCKVAVMLLHWGKEVITQPIPYFCLLLNAIGAVAMPSDKVLGRDLRVSTTASNFDNICCWASLVSWMCRLKLGWMSITTSSMSTVLLRLALCL